MSQIDLQWFAAEAEGRTEQPSEYKLSKARKEGRVAKSQELNGSVVFLLTSIMLVVLAPWLKNKFCDFLVYYFNNINGEINQNMFYAVFLQFFLMMVLPISLVGVVASIIANLIQTRGFIFSTKPIQPKITNIVPKFGEYFKRTLFSLQGVFNIFKSIFKVVIIGVISYILIASEMQSKTLNYLYTVSPSAALHQEAGIVAKLLIICAFVLLVIGIADYFVQRHTFMESMKMSKQEVKEEFKELEGDVEMKNRLQQAQRELMKQNMAQAVKEADVVIANPTHFAVALQWKSEVMAAPQVTAKGEDETALTMRRIASENDVPVVENRSLARALYNDTEVGDIIPESYLRAVAIVYSQINYMDKNKNL